MYRFLIATVIVVAFSVSSRADDAECKTAFGKTASGFHCTAGFGEVRCSPRPGGACEAANGHVTCSN